MEWNGERKGREDFHFVHTSVMSRVYRKRVKLEGWMTVIISRRDKPRRIEGKRHGQCMGLLVFRLVFLHECIEMSSLS